MVIIRYMMKDDYPGVKMLWDNIEGFRIRKVDDSQAGILKLLERNPKMSIVAEKDGTIIGNILCGHDGRTGMLYHVCVDTAFRQQGIGKNMVNMAIDALKREGIGTVTLIAMVTNEMGNLFWQKMGWTERRDMNYYNYVINGENVIHTNSGL